MAITLQELLVKVSADISEYDSGMKNALKVSAGVDQAMQGAAASLGDFASQLNSIGASVTKVGSMLTAAITLPLAGVSLAALKVAGDLEQAKVAFTTMLGSAEAAQKHLEELRDFSLKTPFEFGDLVTASKRLQALGFAAKDVIPTLTAIGDAAAGLGMGAVGIERISLALGQMQAKGKVSAQEMNQLAEAGINGWEMLAAAITKATGKTTTIADTMKMAEKGMIDGAAAVQVMLAGMESKFGGLMDAQSKTLLGMWSNLKDNLSKTLSEIGDALEPVAKRLIQSVTDLLPSITHLVEGFAKLPEPVQTAALALAATTAAAGPLLIAFGQVASSVGSIAKAFDAVSKVAGVGSFFASMTADAGTASVAVSGLSGVLGTVVTALGVVASLGVGAFVGLSQLHNDTENLRSLNDEFDKFLLSKTQAFTGPLAPGAGAFDAGIKSINEALDKGLISITEYNKLMSMLKANMENFQIPATTKEALTDFGASFLGGTKLKVAGGVGGSGDDSGPAGLIRAKSPEEIAKEAEKAAQEVQHAFSAIGVKDLQKQVDDAVAAFHKLSDAGKLTGTQMLQAAGHITKLREELAKLTATPHVDPNFMDLSGGIEHAETAVEELHRKIEEFRLGTLKDLPMSISQAFKMDTLTTGSNNVELFNNLLMNTAAGFVANENKAQDFFKSLNENFGLSREQLQGFEDEINKVNALKFFGLQTPAEMRQNADAAKAYFDVLVRTGEPAERLLEIVEHTKNAQTALAMAAELYSKGIINGYQLQVTQLAALEETVRKNQEKGITETLDQSKQIFDLEQKLAKAHVDIWRDVHKEISNAIDALDTGLAHALLDFKNFGADMKKTLTTVLEDVFTDVFKAITKPLTDWLKKTITDAIAPIVASIASKLGLTAANGAASVAGSVAKTGASAGTVIIDETGQAVNIGGAAAGAGGSAAGAASSTASSLTGMVNMISGAVTAISSVVSNFQFAGMNKSLDLVVNHTLRIFNEVFQQRIDHWDQFGKIYDRIGEVWKTIQDAHTATFGRLGEIWQAIINGQSGADFSQLTSVLEGVQTLLQNVTIAAAANDQMAIVQAFTVGLATQTDILNAIEDTLKAILAAGLSSKAADAPTSDYVNPGDPVTESSSGGGGGGGGSSDYVPSSGASDQPSYAASAAPVSMSASSTTGRTPNNQGMSATQSIWDKLEAIVHNTALSGEQMSAALAATGATYDQISEALRAAGARITDPAPRSGVSAVEDIADKLDAITRNTALSGQAMADAMTATGASFDEITAALLRAGGKIVEQSRNFGITSQGNWVNGAYVPDVTVRQPDPVVLDSGWTPLQIIIKDNVFRDNSQIDYLVDLARTRLG